MYLVRDIFRAKPGRSKMLVELFKSAIPHIKSSGVVNSRVFTDASGDFWTVVWEFEVEEISNYFEMSRQVDTNSAVYDSLEGYKDHVIEGRREIFKIE
ncbi:MAG: hypothetical protein JXQ96_02455 [Cyclobacteriaceae bacterium]